MKRCYCTACRARDERRFWRIVAPLQNERASAPLGLPPVPEWEGEPVELYTITRRESQT